jgi:uncharacterized protein YjaG (DUF416 family)
LLFYKCQSTIVLNLSLNWKVFYIDICCFCNVWYPNYIIKCNAEHFHCSTTKIYSSLSYEIWRGYLLPLLSNSNSNFSKWRLSAILYLVQLRIHSCFSLFEILLSFTVLSLEEIFLMVIELKHFKYFQNGGGRHLAFGPTPNK